MVTKISDKEAVAILTNLGLRPLEPYLNSKAKWKSVHIECGTICFPTLERVKLGQVSCPKCRYIRVSQSLRLSDDTAKTLMEKAGYRPLVPYVNALTKWRSIHNECGREVRPTLNQIQQGQGGCASCGHQQTGLKKRNSVSKVEETLLKKDFLLLGEYRGAKEKLRVKCKLCKKEFEANWSVISGAKGRGCKNCALIQAADKYKLKDHEIKKRLDRARMELIGKYKNSTTPVDCLCKQCGKVRRIRLSVLGRGGGCKPCGMKTAGIRRRTGQEMAIQIMREIGKVEPLEPYENQNAKWKSCCLICQKIVYPRLSSVKGQNGLGCVHCSNKARGNNRRIPQIVIYDFLIKEGFIPIASEKFVDSQTNIKCTHTCGAVVSTSYRKLLSNKSKGNGSCRACGAKKYADSARFDISLIDEIYAKQNLKLLSRSYLGMRYKHETICNGCGWKWETLPSKIALGHGCPACSKGSFKPNNPGYIYLITHSEFGAHKVGIANIAKTSLGDRFYHHKKQGWILVARWDSKHGSEIKALEKEILRSIRVDLNIPPYLAKSDMPFGGWTETLSADAISVTKLRDLIELKIIDLDLDVK